MIAMGFVDVATARSAPGVRIVVAGIVPSPWSEAAKGLFRVGNIPVLAVRRMRDAAAITAWTGVDNTPVVFHDAEPARTNWSAITTLAARLAGPDVRVPDEVGARAEVMGLLHEIAGEDGIGWNGRLTMSRRSPPRTARRSSPRCASRLAARTTSSARSSPQRSRRIAR